LHGLSSAHWGGAHEARLFSFANKPRPEPRFYRDRTRALLRRYFRMSIELGRLPSLVGREFFRSRVTSYRMHTFEDAVIFVHDTESCLERLDPFSQQLIARIVFQDYTLEETAALLGCGRRTVVRATRGRSTA
jgi:hypothetical protein